MTTLVGHCNKSKHFIRGIPCNAFNLNLNTEFTIIRTDNVLHGNYMQHIH
jgi:hypothetical protein